MVTYKKGNKILKIRVDEAPENPREWDNVGVMACSHKRYTLGDEQIQWQDFKDWEEIRQNLVKKHDAAVLLPIFMLDHSGLTISTQRFSCPWDSGQIGFIYMTNKVMSDNNFTQNKAIEALKCEIDEYDHFLRCNIYEYEMVDVITCKCCNATKENMIDACCGFYGTDFDKNGLFENAGVNIKEWEEVD